MVQIVDVLDDAEAGEPHGNPADERLTVHRDRRLGADISERTQASAKSSGKDESRRPPHSLAGSNTISLPQSPDSSRCARNSPR